MEHQDNNDFEHDEAVMKRPADATASGEQMELLRLLSDRVMQEANQMTSRIGLAEKIGQEARTEADRIIRDAQKQASEIISKACREAKQKSEQGYAEMMAEAQDEAKKIRGDAESKALRIIQKAQKEACIKAEEETLHIKNEADIEAATIRKEAKKEAHDIIIQARRDAEIAAADEFAEITKKAEIDAQTILKQAQREVELRISEESLRIKRESGAVADEEAASIIQRAREKAQQIKDGAESQTSKITSRIQQEAEADAEEMTLSIKRKAESEADTLVEEARKQARDIVSRARMQAEEEAREKSAEIIQQARQKAIEIEAEAVNRLAQEKLHAIDAIDSYMTGKAANTKPASNDDLPREHMSGEKESGKESLTDCISQIEELLESKAAPAENRNDESLTAPNNNEAANFKNIKENSKPGHEATQEIFDLLNKSVASTVCEPPATIREAISEECIGEVEIVIPPPINVARLLGITRYLEKDLKLKILQTAGSWSAGSVIRVSLDTPLPLIDLLKSIPNVEEVIVLEEVNQSSWPKGVSSLMASCSIKDVSQKISVVLRSDKGHRMEKKGE